LTGVGALAGIFAIWWKTEKITPRLGRGTSERRGRGGDAQKQEEEKKDEKTSYMLPLAMFPVVFPCLYYVTHADLRYRHPADPVICLLTAAAIAGVWEAMRGKKKELNTEGTEAGAQRTERREE
jgi:hypothetical protein